MTSLLSELRAKITAQQRAALTACWRYFCEKGQWIAIRRLHNEHGGKSVVRPQLDNLGGSIIFEQQDPTTPRYQIMFLGVLLTDEGEWYEQLLAQYLGYLVKILQQEPERINVKSEEVAAALSLTQEQTILLGVLLYIGEPFRQSMGGYGTSDWHAAIPDNIEDLPSDLLEYIQQRAIERYYPDAPLAVLARNDYYQQVRVLELQRQNPSIHLSAEPSPVEDEREDVADQRELLKIHRRTLSSYLRRQAMLGSAHAPPEITHGIYEARGNIRRIKNTLREWGVKVEDHPDDVEAGEELHQQSTLSKDDLLWLSTAYRHSPNGERIDSRKVLIELLGKVPSDFDPRTIEHHFCSGGNSISILGRYLIDPNDHIVVKANQIALAVRDILKANTERSVITAQELASITGLPELEVASTLQLMAGHYGGGYFHRAGTSYGSRGWASIRVDEDEVFENYLKFQSIEVLVKQYLK